MITSIEELWRERQQQQQEEAEQEDDEEDETVQYLRDKFRKRLQKEEDRVVVDLDSAAKGSQDSGNLSSLLQRDDNDGDNDAASIASDDSLWQRGK